MIVYCLFRFILYYHFITLTCSPKNVSLKQKNVVNSQKPYLFTKLFIIKKKMLIEIEFLDDFLTHIQKIPIRTLNYNFEFSTV